MEPVTDLPSWLPSLPVLLGGGVLVAILLFFVMRRRSVVVHGPLGTGASPSLAGGAGGSSTPGAELPMPERIHLEIAAGRMISAIKLYREATGVGLKEAKDAVERIRDGGAMQQLPEAQARAVPDGALDGEIAALLAEGKKIAAVKLTRERLHLGLKEAKDYVEDVERTGRGTQH